MARSITTTPNHLCGIITEKEVTESSGGHTSEEGVVRCQIRQTIVRNDGTSDAEEVVRLVDEVVEKCFRELRTRGAFRSVRAVGFACFGMNLVGVAEDGTPCTPVYTYANNGSSSLTSGPGTDSENPTISMMTRLKENLDSVGHGSGAARGDKGSGLEETRQRTGTPTHVSYAPVQLLRLQHENPDLVCKVKTWQTLPSLIAARWCGLSSAPVSYSEASWMGLLDFRRLQWDTPTLSVLQEAGFNVDTLPSLADIGGLQASPTGWAVKRWPELDGAAIRLGVGDGAAACLGSGCGVSSGRIAVTVGTSAAARVVLHLPASPCLNKAPCGKNTSGVPEGVTPKLGAGTETTAVDRCGRDGNRLDGRTTGTNFSVPEGLWCYRLDRDRVVLGGSLTDGGSVFEWFQGTLGIVDGESLDCVMREARHMKPASHGLVVLPFFAGERSPGYNDSAKACILGLRRCTTRAHLMRAGMESVCLRLAAIVDLMCAHGDASVDNDPLTPRDPTGVYRDGPLEYRAEEVTLQRASEQTVERRTNDQVQSTAAASVAVSPTHKIGEERIPPVVGVVSRDAGVVTSGGAIADSSLWKQILADTLGRDVQDSGRTEETSLGVAVLLSSLEYAGDRERSVDEVAGFSHSSAEDGIDDIKPDGVVYKPDEDSFGRYSAARFAQERVYKALFGSSNVCAGVI